MVVTPGVKADVQIPFLGALTGNMDIDGLRLYPDSKVAGIHINADDAKEAAQMVGEWTKAHGQRMSVH